MKNARRYELDLTELISCGLGTCTGATKQYNLLNSFTVNCNTYPAITTTQLKSISVNDFNTRVSEFIDYIKIEDNTTKTKLIDEASFDTPACDVFQCKLNPDFLVYKFLSGVRIVNTGSVNGLLEYKLYPSGANPNDYNWESTGTYLNLNSNGVYNVEIRDNVNGEIVCSYIKTISMSLLTPSTTVTLPTKIIRISETSSDLTSTLKYKTGVIDIQSPLSSGQCFKLNFTADAVISDGAISAVNFYCKGNGSSTYSTYCSITNSNSVTPKTGLLSIGYGDTMCYNISVCATNPGAEATADFNLTTIDGLNTIIPNIDTSNCSTSITTCVAPLDITVKLVNNTSCSPNSNTCVLTGLYYFDNPIPANNSITMNLTTTNYTIGGSSKTEIYCKTGNSSIYALACTVCNTSTQPQHPVITAYSGDNLCYRITLNAPSYGTSANGLMSIDSLTATYGINPILSSNISDTCVSGSIALNAINTTVSVCRTSSTSNCSTGFVTVNPTLSTSNQYISMMFDVTQVAIGCSNIYGSDSRFELFCKPNNGTSFVSVCLLEAFTDVTNTYINRTCHGSIQITCGDCLCYQNFSQGISGSCSEFNVCALTTSNDINGTINSTKYNDIVTA